MSFPQNVARITFLDQMSDKKISNAFADELFNLIKKHGADISQVLALVTSIYMTTEDASVMTAVIDDKDGYELLSVRTEYGGFEMVMNRIADSIQVGEA